uniref:Protein kinase domain-containing protein n=1 Tax=Leersia perrieri TaxID=77586 RepID=A0A0D9XVK9_9ORYZ
MTFAQRFERGVPLVLDWAIRNNGTCSSPTPSGGKNGKQQTSACVSVNSHCVNATNGLDIDECKENPCIGGTCHDTEGGFECKCNFGRRRDSEDDNACQPVLTKPAIVAIATLCAISILAIILLFLHMEREKRKLRDFFQKNDGQLLKTMGIKIFKKKEIDRITNNYGKILGKGGFGLVYMGITDSKQQVAVKCPNPISVDPARQKDFTNEVTIQSQISHKNVVRLLGCCLETNIPMLVYEFIPKGSLHDVLHGNSDDSNVVAKSTLSLQVRLGIAIESTEALNYMHSSASQKIIHGDVKSSNILLDENFTPKVSDFGISRLLSIDKHHTKFVIGDANYMDPIYMKTGLLTEKSDVYSFGVVLLELITRKKARYDGNKSLSLTFVKSYMTECRAREMFDEEITCNTEDINCLEMISRIAVECLQEDVDKRPTMKEVLEYLHLARKEWMQRQGKISCDQADEIAIDYSPLTHHSYPA